MARLRRFLTPGWVLLHLFTVAAVVAMILLGRWQLIVSDRKHFDLQNFGYAIQWWLFSIFAAWLWWRLVRDALRPTEGSAGPGEGEAGSAGVGDASPAGTSPAGTSAVNATAVNATAAEPAAAGAGAGSAASDIGPPAGPEVAAPSQIGADAAPEPAGYRRYLMPQADQVAATAEDDMQAAYNDYLRGLNERADRTASN